MIGDNCPICKQGKLLKNNYDKGEYCDRGCWIPRKNEIQITFNNL